MKKAKKFISLMLAFCMLMMTATTALAAEPNSTPKTSGQQISFSELPDSYKEIISPDAIIYRNADGSYDIFQNNPVLPPVATRASERYAPKGGSYTDLENGWITSLTCVVYQTYLPRDNVDTWISDHNDGMSDYIIGLVASLGLAKADQIAAKVLSKYGISISIRAIAAIAEGVIFTLDWMNYQQVITASDSGKNGILIEYLTNIGSGNARVYSSWTSSYVPMKPYGGNATWHAEDYYVMP